MDSQSQKFQNLVEQFLLFLGRAVPHWATEAGEARFDHILGEVSDDAILGTLQEIQAWEKRFEEEIRPQELSTEEQLDYELLTRKLKSQRQFWEETQPWRQDPTLYVSFLTDSILSLAIAYWDQPSLRAEKMQARLSQIPAALKEAQRNLTQPPREFVLTAIEMTRGSLEYFKKLLRDFPKLKKPVLQAWAGYLHFLKRTLLPRANGSPRLGKGKYDFLLRQTHFLEWGSKELLEWGEESFQKKLEEIKRHASQMDSKRPWLEILRNAKEPTPSAHGLLDFYRRLMREAWEFVREKQLLELPPEMRLEVGETPPYERPIIASACYIPIAALNPRSRGMFFVTPVERSPLFWKVRQVLKKEHTFSEALLTVVHESFPGHHAQFLHAMTYPSKLRRLFYDEFYSEGWAFYAEQMMLEAGFHSTPMTWLFQKRNELWRALRVVIDVRLHTDDSFLPTRAAELMREHLGYEVLYARREVNRYLLDPVQATSYYLGKSELLRLKEEVARREGNSFCLSRFHNRLLSFGSLPFSFLRRLFF